MKWRRRALCRFAIALTDIHGATQTCELMLEEKPGLADPRYWAYHTAIINGYARPFTVNRPLGKLPESVVRILESEERSLHNDILRERDTAAAHSDLDARPVYFAPRGAKMLETGEKFDSAGFVTGKTAWTFELWERVHQLTNRIGEHVQAEAFNLVEQVYGDMYAPEMIRIEVE